MAYTVYCIHADRETWVRSLRDRLSTAVAGLGDPVDTIQVCDGFPSSAGIDADAPAMAVYLGSPGGAESEECSRQIDVALAAGLLVLPCVNESENFIAHTPEGPLRRLNGVEWPTEDAPQSIVHFALEALGLEERQRMVFLSHRRSDALAMAEQLHDRLIKNRFWPFVDRFDIDPGVDVQRRIYAALEETAFVVLVESPQAALSPWVLEEVHYALRESLGMLIVTFPETAPLAGTEGLPRFFLDESKLIQEVVEDLESQSAHRTHQLVLTADAVEELVQEIEAIHAKALVRRRRRLVGEFAGEQPDLLLVLLQPAAEGVAGVVPVVPVP